MAAQALEWQSSAHHFRVGLSQRLMRKRGFWFGAFAVQDSKEANHFEVADCVAKRGVRPSDDLFRCHCFPSFLAGRGRAGLPGERQVDCEMVDVPRLAIAHPCRRGTFAGAYPCTPCAGLGTLQTCR